MICKECLSPFWICVVNLNEMEASVLCVSYILHRHRDRPSSKSTPPIIPFLSLSTPHPSTESSFHILPHLPHLPHPFIPQATQIPPQSAPPFSGSQSSLGSSTQVNLLGHEIPANPPQNSGSMQTPPQSAPPFFGSQSSRGSSTQIWFLSAQGIPAKPPQKAPALKHVPPMEI